MNILTPLCIVKGVFNNGQSSQTVGSLDMGGASAQKVNSCHQKQEGHLFITSISNSLQLLGWKPFWSSIFFHEINMYIFSCTAYLVTVFWQTKCVTKSRLYCTYAQSQLLTLKWPFLREHNNHIGCDTSINYAHPIILLLFSCKWIPESLVKKIHNSHIHNTKFQGFLPIKIGFKWWGLREWDWIYMVTTFPWKEGSVRIYLQDSVSLILWSCVHSWVISSLVWCQMFYYLGIYEK